MKERAIGIFDSGLGGLAVAKEVLREMPQEDIIYFADFAHLPYGPRPSEEVKEFTLQAVDFFISMNVKAILIACNTASAAGMEEAQEKASEVPVIGMIEPAVKATLAHGDIQKVGVIGTIGTIKSKVYEKTFQAKGTKARIFSNACPDLLRLAEQDQITDMNKIEELARICVYPLEKEGIDVLVLGCTDFTCIKDQLRKVLAPHIKIVDPAMEVARTADEALQMRRWRRLGRRQGRFSFHESGEGPKQLKEFAEKVFNIKIGAINPIRTSSLLP
jgi:glutamate racemase